MLVLEDKIKSLQSDVETQRERKVFYKKELRNISYRFEELQRSLTGTIQCRVRENPQGLFRAVLYDVATDQIIMHGKTGHKKPKGVLKFIRNNLAGKVLK